MERDPNNTVNIPKCLHKPIFRFVKVAPKEKRAIEMAWNKNANYAYNDPNLLSHLANGGNYGFITGIDNVIVLDADHPELHEWCEKNLPETFKVKTRKGCHYYYRAPDLPKKVILKKEGTHYGDVQHVGQYVVGPNSVHPSGATYTPLNQQEITTLNKELIEAVLDLWTEDKQAALAPPKNAGLTLKARPIFDPVEQIKSRVSVPSILGRYGVTTSKNPTECPMHSSNGGKCLSFKHDVWNCFHCQKAGDIFSLVMEAENIGFKEAMNKIAEDFGIDIKPPEVVYQPPEKTTTAAQEETTETTTTPPPTTQQEKYTQEELLGKLTPQQKADIARWGTAALQQLAQNNPNPLRATECLVNALNIKTKFWAIRQDEKTELWKYEEGIFVPNGKTYIQEFIREIFGENYRTSIVNPVIQKIEVDNYISQEEFQDKAPQHLIPLENGLLNINTKELEPYTSEYVFLAKLPVKYDPTANCKEIKKFYAETLPTNKEFLIIQEMYGYFLLRSYPFEKSFMLLGRGSNGKSKHLELCQEFLGYKNTATVTLEQIEKDQYAIANLFGKLANLAGDISNKPIESSSDFKALTGGDWVNANRKHMTHLKFKNYAKLVFSANDIPRTYDESDGFFRRWIIIDFPHKFVHPNVYEKMSEEEIAEEKVKKADINLMEKLTTQQELSGLLNLALQGLDRLRDQNGFSDSERVQKIRADWLRRSNSFFAFMKDHIVFDRGSRIVKKDLKRVYTDYCQKYGLTTVSDGMVKVTLSKDGISDGRPRLEHGSLANDLYGERPWIWEGIAFKEGGVLDLTSNFSIYKGELGSEEVVDKAGQGGQGGSPLQEPSQKKKYTGNPPDHLTQPCPFIKEQHSEENEQQEKQEKQSTDLKNPQETTRNIGFFVKKDLFIKALDELHEEGHDLVDTEVWYSRVIEHHEKTYPNWVITKDYEKHFDEAIKSEYILGETYEPKPGRFQRLK